MSASLDNVRRVVERLRESADATDRDADGLAKLGAKYAASAARQIAQRTRDDAADLEREADALSYGAK